MNRFFRVVFLFLLLPLPLQVNATTINLNAPSLVPEVSLLLSPTSGSFETDGTFAVSLLVDTKGRSVNSLEIAINFDPDKLLIVGPSGGTSVIGVWVEPPVYDNVLGTARYVGVIPGGIVTSSGLVNSITFKAKRPGQATVSLSANSKVYLNDGLGSTARVNLGRATFSIIPKVSPGVQVFSETHPIQSNWYNNNNPILLWEREAGTTGYSYVIDNQPGTVPDNTSDSEATKVQFKDLKDGVWYFHLKSIKDGLWGQPSTFVVRVDTTPPADFKPSIDYLLASLDVVERGLVSYFTTDNLSGIDHYEVGVIDKGQLTTASPVFLEAASPYQVPLKEGVNLRVLVRAFDRAGNVRESGIDVKVPFFMDNFLKSYGLLVLIGFLSVILGLITLHYFIAHHLIRHIKKGLRAFQDDTEDDDKSPSTPIIQNKNPGPLIRQEPTVISPPPEKQ